MCPQVLLGIGHLTSRRQENFKERLGACLDEARGLDWNLMCPGIPGANTYITYILVILEHILNRILKILKILKGSKALYGKAFGDAFNSSYLSPAASLGIWVEAPRRETFAA